MVETIKCKFSESSAKTGKNIVEAFHEIARINYNDSNNSDRVELVVLSREGKKNKKK